MAHVIIVTASVRKFGFGTLDSDIGLPTSGFGLGSQACQYQRIDNDSKCKKPDSPTFSFAIQQSSS